MEICFWTDLLGQHSQVPYHIQIPGGKGSWLTSSKLGPLAFSFKGYGYLRHRQNSLHVSVAKHNLKRSRHKPGGIACERVPSLETVWDFQQCFTSFSPVKAFNQQGFWKLHISLWWWRLAGAPSQLRHEDAVHTESSWDVQKENQVWRSPTLIQKLLETETHAVRKRGSRFLRA